MKRRLFFTITIIIISINTYAQKLQSIPPMTKEIHDSAWYAKQAELWRLETEKDKNNQNAWFNYYMAKRYVIRGLPYDEWEKGKRAMEQDMDKNIPGTYAYKVLRAMSMGAWDKESIPLLESAFTERKDDPVLHKELIVRYEVWGTTEKRQEINKLYYKTSELSSQLLNYNYNVLQSLNENAILLTIGDNDTYPLWMLQDVMGIRKDVVILNMNLVCMDEYRNKLFKENGISLPEESLKKLVVGPKALPEDRVSLQENIVKELAKHTKRPVYLALTCGTEHFVEVVQDKLYNTGLSSIYSETPIDDLALIRKNYEKIFLLDYLKVQFNPDEYEQMLKMINQNYFPGFIKLYRHYRLSGDDAKADEIKEIILLIAKRVGKERQLKDYLK